MKRFPVSVGQFIAGLIAVLVVGAALWLSHPIAAAEPPTAR